MPFTQKKFIALKELVKDRIENYYQELQFQLIDDGVDLDEDADDGKVDSRKNVEQLILELGDEKSAKQSAIDQLSYKEVEALIHLAKGVAADGADSVLFAETGSQDSASDSEVDDEDAEDLVVRLIAEEGYANGALSEQGADSFKRKFERIKAAAASERLISAVSSDLQNLASSFRGRAQPTANRARQVSVGAGVGGVVADGSESGSRASAGDADLSVGGASLASAVNMDSASEAGSRASDYGLNGARRPSFTGSVASNYADATDGDGAHSTLSGRSDISNLSEAGGDASRRGGRRARFDDGSSVLSGHSGVSDLSEGGGPDGGRGGKKRKDDGKGGSDSDSTDSGDDDDALESGVDKSSGKGADDHDFEWRQVSFSRLMAEGYVNEPNNEYLIPQIIGKSFGIEGGPDYHSGIAQHRSGLPVFIYGDGTPDGGKSGLHEFTRQCHAANNSRTITGDTRLASIARIKNHEGKGDSYCVATLSSRGLSQNWVSQEVFEANIMPISNKLYEDCLNHEGKMQRLQKIAAKIQGYSAADGLDITSTKSSELVKIFKSINAWSEHFKEALVRASSEQEKAKIYGEIAAKYESLQKTISGDKANFTDEQRKEIADIFDEPLRNPPLAEKERARQFSSRQLSGHLANEVEKSIVKNQVQVDLDQDEISSVARLMAVGKFPNRHVGDKGIKDESAKLRSLLSATMPHSPFPGSISILTSPRSSNTTTITFNERTDNCAWIYIPGTPECYVKVRVCNEDAPPAPPIASYKNGKYVVEAHKKGDIIMDEGTIYRFKDGSYGNPIGTEGILYGASSGLADELGKERAKAVRDAYKSLKIKAMSTIDGERRVGIMSEGETFKNALSIKAAGHAVEVAATFDANRNTTSLTPSQKGYEPIVLELDEAGKAKGDHKDKFYFAKVMDVPGRNGVEGFEILTPIVINDNNPKAIANPEAIGGVYIAKRDPSGKALPPELVSANYLKGKFSELGATKGDWDKFEMRLRAAQVVVMVKKDVPGKEPEVTAVQIQLGNKLLDRDANPSPKKPSPIVTPLWVQKLGKTPENTRPAAASPSIGR